jgi:hypothetical protein
MPQHDYIDFFIDEHIAGYQLNVSISTDGSKWWQEHYNYPEIGVGFNHSNLGNTQIYGDIYSLYGYVDRTFFNNQGRFNMGNRISYGLGYITKTYNPNTNYFDMVIGSHLNAYLSYCLEGFVRITPQFTLTLGAAFSHTSNGNIKEPNKGLNIITSCLSLQYSFQKSSRKHYVMPTDVKDTSKNQLQFLGSLGWKQISRSFGTTYTVSSVSAEYARRISQTGWVGLATGFYYDPSIRKEISLDSNDTVKASTSDLIRITLNLSYELKMGSISFIIQPGIYLKNAYTKPGHISNRIGVRYQVNDRLSAGVTIKANWVAVADYIEWGIGYRLKN